MRMKIRIAAVVSTVVLVLSAAGCFRLDDLGAGNEYLVKKVIDGDTIELSNGRVVRYIGIDTPETMRRKGGEWVFNPEEYAVAAKTYNTAFVSGKKVRIEFDENKEDKYGRWLAYVYTDDGDMVNRELVRVGYATLLTYPPNTKYMSVFLEAREEARSHKRGFWESIEVISPEKAFENIGKIRGVRGKISNVYVGPGKIFLNFSDGKSTLLTAVIYSGNIPFFAKKGIADPVNYYRDRDVEIVGKIEYRGGTRMVVDNPSQITVIGE